MSRRSLDHTLELITSLDRAGSVNDVVKTVKDRLSGFGIETVLAALLPSGPTRNGFDRRFIVFENVPEDWKRIYLTKGYVAADPIVRETLRRPTGFGWSDDDIPRIDDPMSGRVMGEAAEIGMRDGYTVPLTTLEGDRGGMTFTGRHLDIAPEHRGMLTLAASYAFGRALRLRGQLPDIRGTLSPRERETLQWAAEGKTDWEIGEIMGISEHGVDAHFRAVRVKLAVRSRAQAVAEGMRRNLIT